MPSFVKIGILSNRVVLGDPEQSAEELIPLLEEHKGCGVLVLPPYCLGGNVGKLACGKTWIDTAEQAFLRVQNAAGISILLLGRYHENGSLFYEILCQGKTMAEIPMGGYQLFNLCGMRTCLYTAGTARLAFDLGALETEGVELLLVCEQAPANTVSRERRDEIMKVVSRSLGCRLFYINGGAGDTSAPYLYEASAAEYFLGEKAFSEEDTMEAVCYESILDPELIKGYKRNHGLPLAPKKELVCLEVPRCNDNEFTVSADPFLPKEKADFLERLFVLQASSLAVRLRNIGARKVVLGVSGGLDSTLALLVCQKAMDLLNLPPENIVAVTMQGFGTSGRTYENALKLMQGLGCTIREIPIRDAVLQHFSDIGQDPQVHDTAYENAQARERTQILLDISNQIGGIVVGTGDLSEAALGFCTFAGDHIANYNVNVCVTKTMMRQMVSHLAESGRFASCGGVLRDILATPISPELLPADENGGIAQKTEEILGPYELHDFFLYYFLEYGLSTNSLEFYAQKAFPEISSEEIGRCAKLFFRRFVQNQFKRSCAPDCACLTEVNLTAAAYEFPSDCSSKVFQR